MNKNSEPCADNAYLSQHIDCLLTNYQRWTTRSLLPPEAHTQADIAQWLYLHAPFALLSHDTRADPVFNYANKTAQTLFEMSWQQFVLTPSRLSAEAPQQAERDRLLQQVSEHGYIDDYSGVRVSSTGKRFHVNDVVVWNLYTNNGHYYGQAAQIQHWAWL